MLVKSRKPPTPDGFSFAQMFNFPCKYVLFYQATGRTRTGDPRITNALRYQLRYSGIRTAIAIPLMQQGCCLSNSLAIMTWPGIEPGFTPWEGVVLAAWPSGLKVNRGDVIRTRGLCVPNAALYQTEPRLDTFGSIIHLFQKVNHKLSKFLK